jgi:Bacteriophage HK97-gp10, putative tail-component
MDFTITISGIAALTAAFQQYPQISLPILQRALSASGAILAQNTTRSTVPWRTGFLTQSFRAQLTGLVLTWFPTASYAGYVEFGTAPHVITAKNAKALYWPGALHPVKSVNHPGTKPNDYMGRIVRASQDDINEMFGTALGQITQAIAEATQ